MGVVHALFVQPGFGVLTHLLEKVPVQGAHRDATQLGQGRGRPFGLPGEFRPVLDMFQPSHKHPYQILTSNLQLRPEPFGKALITSIRLKMDNLSKNRAIFDLETVQLKSQAPEAAYFEAGQGHRAAMTVVLPPCSGAAPNCAANQKTCFYVGVTGLSGRRPNLCGCVWLAVVAGLLIRRSGCRAGQRGDAGASPDCFPCCVSSLAV